MVSYPVDVCRRWDMLTGQIKVPIAHIMASSIVVKCCLEASAARALWPIVRATMPITPGNRVLAKKTPAVVEVGTIATVNSGDRNSKYTFIPSQVNIGAVVIHEFDPVV